MCITVCTRRSAIAALCMYISTYSKLYTLFFKRNPICMYCIHNAIEHTEIIGPPKNEFINTWLPNQIIFMDYINVLTWIHLINFTLSMLFIIPEIVSFANKSILYQLVFIMRCGIPAVPHKFSDLLIVALYIYIYILTIPLCTISSSEPFWRDSQ